MNTLLITSTRTMAYDAQESAQGFAIIEKLAGMTGAVLKTVGSLARGLGAPALRAARA